MRAAASTAIIAGLLLAASQAANAGPAFVCDQCRALSEHPIDAANFGLNATLGPDAFIFGSQADQFDVVDLFGNRVTVDINFSYRDGWFFPVFVRRFPIPVPIPDFNLRGRAILQAIVRNAQGKVVLNLRIQARKVKWPLKVGPFRLPVAPPPINPPGGPAPNGGEGGGEDEPRDGGDYEGEFPEPDTDSPKGIVEIIDLDNDYGDFPEWLEEL